MSSDRDAATNVGLLHELPLCKAQHDSDDDHVAPPASAPGNPPAPAPGAAPGAYPPPAGAPPPGQAPYPYPYAMPPGGYYPPPPPGSYYPPPPGQYPQYPGYYPYGAPPAGQYPPAGFYPPPPGAPGAPASPSTDGTTEPAPPAGAPPPPPQHYPPPGSSPYAMPVAVGGYSPVPPPGAYYPPPPPTTQPAHRDPLVYLGTSIPDPEAPPAQHGVQKVKGYDPAHDYNALTRAVTSGDEKQCQSHHHSPSTVSSPLSSLSPRDEKDQASLAAVSRSPSSSSSSHYSSSSVTLGTAAPSAVPLKSSSSKSPPSSRLFLNNRLGAMLTLTTDSTRTVLNVMKRLNVFEMDALNDYCVAKSGISLADKLDKATNFNFGLTIRALALGPLGYDVELAHKALIGMGTNEMLLIELILGRPGHEIRWLKTGYRKRYGRDLVDHVKSDLSGKLERLFIMALNTQKPDDGPLVVVDPARVNQDIHNLHHAAQKKDEIAFCEVLVNRSNAHIAAVITGYGQQYKSLSKVIKKSFSGTMEQALLYIMHGVKAKRDGQGYWRDAKLLEKSMAGLGTRDVQLIYRVVRAHWDPRRMECVKEAYKRRYGKTLEHRVKGETSGLYRDMLVELIQSGKM